MSLSVVKFSAGCLVVIAIASGMRETPAGETATAGEALRRKLTLVRTRSIQAELGLSATQKATIKTLVGEVDLPLWQLRTANAEIFGQRLPALDKTFNAQLASTLSAEQLRRLDQLCWRSKGSSNLVQDAGFVDKVGLTPSQCASIAEVLGSGKATNEAPATDAEQKILAIFTAPQRERLSGLVGKSFDFRKVHEIGVHAPEIVGIEGWVNSPPLKMDSLRGKVVVVTFWTFNCINCIHNLPIYQNWYDTLPKDKVVILGIHTPEMPAEREFTQLEQAVKQRGLKYPVAMDLHAKTWNVWANNIWPATYVVDKQGDVRTWWTGELQYNGAHGDKIVRRSIEELIAEKETENSK